MLYYSLFFLFVCRISETCSTTYTTYITCIYLNGLILFPDKTPPLPPATYLYIYNVYGVVACWLMTLGGVTHVGGCCWLKCCYVVVKHLFAQEAEGSHSMRSAKKIHAFIGVVSCVCCCWLRREWQRFQTK